MQVNGHHHTKQQIAGWIVDPESDRLTNGCRQIKLEPKIMQVLSCLMENPGSIVSKDELMQRVWPEVTITDHPINRSISHLRKVFNDTPKNSQVIETIPKKGYRFLVASEPIPQPNSRRWLGAAIPLFLLLTAGFIWKFTGFSPIQVSFESFQIESEHPEGEMYALGFMEALTQKLRAGAR